MKVALYARVSSEQQARQTTIDSQIAALKERAAADGHSVLPSDLYVDDGYSGSTLRRPALERLRDRVAEGGVDILYVHTPDRLARRYAYQVLLLDEFSKQQVRVVMLQGHNGQTAEDQLLLQVQGVIAEYERAKILERSRRGKLHRLQQGMLSPFGGAPYGYLFVKKTAETPACFQVVLHEARVVRRIFDSVVRKRMSMFRIVHELNAEKVPTRGNSPKWTITALHEVLRNPAYMGKAAYGKTEKIERGEPLRVRKDRAAVPRTSKSSMRRRPHEEWIYVSVPPIVSEDIFLAAREQLERNQKHARRNRKPERYLVSGLPVCKLCGFAYSGHTIFHHELRRTYTYAYYRCGSGCNRGRVADFIRCKNPPVRVDQLDQHVWQSVRELLEEPDRVLEEWMRRSSADQSRASLASEREEAARNVQAHERALRRLVDAFEAGVLDLGELKNRSERVRARVEQARKDLATVEAALASEKEMTLVVNRLQDFSRRVRDSLDQLTWQERREIVRTIVKQIDIDTEGATIVYRVPLPSPENASQTDFINSDGGVLWRLTH